MSIPPELVAAIATELRKEKQISMSGANDLSNIYDWVSLAVNMSMHTYGKVDAIHVLLELCRYGNFTPTEELAMAIINGKSLWSSPNTTTPPALVAAKPAAANTQKQTNKN